MLLELVKKYKLSKENNSLEEDYNRLLLCFQNASNFNNLDINLLLKYLEEVNYTTYSKAQIITTINYIKRNNLFNSIPYQEFLKSIYESLSTLKSKKNTNSDNLLSRIDALIETINNKDLFIEDLILVKQILKESNIDIEDIYKIMNDINKHNRRIVKKEKPTINELLEKYGFKVRITNYEANLLKDNIEEKLEYISKTLEFNFLKETSSSLKLTLTLLAPLDNIKEILKLSRDVNLNLESIFPIFYLNEDYVIDDNQENYYSLFKGSYETFTKNTRLLHSLGCDINDLYENFGGLFYIDTNVLISNIENLTKYNISFKIPSVLESDDLVSKIDMFIESGLYDYIMQVPQILLNKDKALFHRIYYAKKNNLPIKNRFLSKEITSLNGYNINEENYLDLVPTYKLPKFDNEFYKQVRITNPSKIDNRIIKNVIKILDDNFLERDNVYKISDVLVSRNKVIRLFQSFLNLNTNNINYIEGLIFSIVNDLLITKDEFDLIVLNVLGKYVNSNTITENDAINISKSLNVDNSRIESLFNGGNRL